MSQLKTTVQLPVSLRQRMLDHARLHRQQEVCGLIGGVHQQLKSYYPVENIAKDPAKRFLMDPEGQIDAMRRMRKAGEELLGIFHSHPSTQAQPSATDLEQAAYPGVIYFIISLMGEIPELNGFYYDGERFSQPLTIE